MKKLLVVSPLLLIILVYLFWPERVVTYPPGITAPTPPQQTNLPSEKKWTEGEYTIEALAEYKIKARVLSRNNFSFGKESDLSPFDLALGWGPMSDQNVIDQIDISQRNRWYNWQADVLPLPRKEISLNSANVHIIPKDESVEDNFDKVYKGSLIEMKGYLVKVTAPGGWRWVSSLRRDDTRGGSCELFWVGEIIVFDN
ncbi:MAG: hypothetical protein HKO83_08940 [Ignavibacteriaceae bacterium]|nr:hypothetical protein [Ignavibacteria bacterium]NNL21425.1 hypothetical protein [Ignavibacteriaceae bacterium]